VPSPVQVQFAIDDAERALAIVDELLGARLISCGQRLGPVTSRYRWQGRIEEAEEWLVLGKTTDDQIDAVVAAIAAAHPYETPEVIVTPIVGGLAGYLAWNEAESRP
jgi:periplasmic divalent cation tolerance protein